jgi:hypothetical protein
MSARTGVAIDLLLYIFTLLLCRALRVSINRTEQVDARRVATATLLGWGGDEAGVIGLSHPNSWVMVGSVEPVPEKLKKRHKDDHKKRPKDVVDLSKIGLLNPEDRNHRAKWVAATPAGTALRTMQVLIVCGDVRYCMP